MSKKRKAQKKCKGKRPKVKLTIREAARVPKKRKSPTGKTGEKKKSKTKEEKRSTVKGPLQIYADAIIAQIADGTLDALQLNPQERRACVATLRHEPMTLTAMAAFLKVSRPTIYNDLKEIRRGLGILVESLTVDNIIGDFIDRSENLYRRALSEDIRLAWMIIKGQFEVMQQLGYVRKHLGDLTLKDQIDAMDDPDLDKFIKSEGRFFEKAALVIKREVKQLRGKRQEVIDV